MFFPDCSVVPDHLGTILDSLACPDCWNGLVYQQMCLLCQSCDRSYPIIDDIIDLRPLEQTEKPEEVAWSRHWSDTNQKTLSQRFFSFYRKSVFSFTVQYFVNRYFHHSGIFVEAGSGTSETSMRIEKLGGNRTLVAVDIVLPVLERCHPTMDVRICADIFHLPFRDNSIDGIWNVGVMEHFTHHQIDLALGQFRRVLREGGRMILLWPGVDSIPQKILRIIEQVVNLKRRAEPFSFHPEEISQLSSTREGRDILSRNGFRTVHMDWGLRSLMAFKTLVGAKAKQFEGLPI